MAYKEPTEPIEQRSNGAKQSPKPTVVGIGASAGGLGALKQLFAQMPEDSGLAFVVVVHLSPEHKSHLADLLQPNARVPVRQVTETVSLEANNVYVIPPNANLSAIDTHLRLTQLEENRRERAPIDHFFRTLAKTHDGHSIGVILTGTGSDGTLGLREIKAKGGVILVQDPNEAEFDGMPQSAIATGLVDRILPLADIPETLLRLARIVPQLKNAGDGEDPTAAERVFLPKVIAILKTRTERDFSRYKPATLLRRITRRMQLNYIESLDSYLDRLREQPDEARALADDLLINVTSFFRDPEVFEKLHREGIPHLFEGKSTVDTVRVWSVGCATGEEAYSLAILLLEEAARHEESPKLQIFASDLHKRSLDSAREGLYPGDIQTDVSPERLKRFFQKENGGYRICKEVRDLVVFAPHNLLSDPPFSKLDLITCRNLLIYLERGVQRDVIDLFHYTLCPNGYLLLGSAETIDSPELFRTEDKKLCMYRKRNVPAPEPRLPVFPLTRYRIGTGPASKTELTPADVPFQAMHHDLLERYAPPSILVGPDNKLVHLSEHAGRYLVLPGGETTLSALRLVREELRIELSGLLQAARDGKNMLDSRPIPVRFNGHSAPVVMHIRPAQTADQEGFVLVIFEEHQAQADAVQQKSTVAGVDGASELVAERNRELEAELNSARQRLQAIIEEYETSREEMKASHEEMQSTNEELRSTMEELETSKEELQSINEELQTVNQENRHKVEELSQLSSDLQNLLTSTDIATLFLDRDFRILRFTPRLADLFNVRVTDRGRPISDLTHRLGYAQLREDARVVLERLVPIEREIQDEAGRWYLTRVLPYRSTDDRIEGVVITLVEITARRKTEEALRESETLRRVALAGGRMGTWRWNLAARTITGDSQFLALWGFLPSNDPLPLSLFTGRMSPEGSAEMEAIVTKTIASEEEFDGPLEIVSGPTAGHWIQWRGRADAFDKSVLYGVTFDVTLQKQAEALRRESEERQAFLLKLSDRLRLLADAAKIQSETTRLISEHLDLDRCYFFEADHHTGEYIIYRDFRRGDLRSVAGRHRMDQWPEMTASLSRGEILVVDNYADSSDIPPEERPPTANLDIGAIIIVPLVRQGSLVACISAIQTVPRKWKSEEVSLVTDVAERTWAAVERARAELALQQSEEQYRVLFESIDEGVTTFEVLFDENDRPVDCLYLETNPALTHMTGLTNDIIGKRTSEVLPNLEPSWLETYGHVVKTGESARVERFVGDLGRWFDLYASRVGGEGSHKIVSVYSDITVRKRDDEALRESEDRKAVLLQLSDALNSLSDPISIQQAAMKVLAEHLSLSRAFYFRVERDEDSWAHVIDSDYCRDSSLRSMVGRHSLKNFGSHLFEQLAHGAALEVDDVAALPGITPAEIASYKAVGVAAFVNVPLRRNGEYSAGITGQDTVPRDWKQAEIELMREVGDRTWAAVERARAEEAQRESEERFRLFVENVREYALVQTDFEGVVTSWNPGAERLFGYTSTEIVGRPFSLLLPEEDRHEGIIAREMAKSSRGERVIDGHTVQRQDGTRFWAEWITEPVLDDAGKLRGTAKVMRDETERQEADLFMRNSLAEKEELLKEVHHRVKNNLQVITSLLNLQADQIVDKQTLVAFDEARNRVASIASIHELLYRSSSLAAIHLAAYAQEFAPSLLNFYGMQDRVKIEVIGDGVQLELERAVPYGLLLNELLSNAFKHAFPQGRGGTIQIEFQERGGFITLVVDDDGVGLPSNFDPEKTHSLGLKLVRRLATQLRGRATFGSDGNGTRVEVQFPHTVAKKSGTPSSRSD